MLLQAKSILAAAKQENTGTSSAAAVDSAMTSSDETRSSNNVTASSTKMLPLAGSAPTKASSEVFSTSTSSSIGSAPALPFSSNSSSDEDVGLSDLPLKGVNADDVLCGRSEVSHIGNKKYRRVIEEHREAYQNAPSRRKKTELSWQIIVMIRQSGGRFLKMDDDTGEWQELDDKQAKEKVSHALRSAKDPDRPRQRKPRVVKKHVPTAKEEMLYHHILRDQQELFRTMMKREGCDVNDLVLR